jgi:putative SOS response-associated peptidase YedK
MEPDGGMTSIRNVQNTHWKRWLGVESRCVVPFTSLSEFNKAEGGDIWIASDESRPLAFFAGIQTPWTSVRKVKEGETTNELFGFLTTDPNAEVGAVHPKDMPVILRTADEIEAWLTQPAEEALKLQRPLLDGGCASSPAARRKTVRQHEFTARSVRQSVSHHRPRITSGLNANQASTIKSIASGARIFGHF